MSDIELDKSTLDTEDNEFSLPLFERNGPPLIDNYNIMVEKYLDYIKEE